MATSENENDKSIRCETHPGITLTANGTCRACNREAKQQRLHEKMVAAGAAPLKLGAQRIAECHAAYDQAKADIANLLGWLECERRPKIPTKVGARLEISTRYEAT